MKTLLVLAALVTLVGLGVWNSPKAEHDEGYSVVRTMKLTGDLVNIPSVIVDEAIVYEPVKADAIPWAEYTEGVKSADEIANQQAEWAGEEYGSVFLPGAEMQEVSTYRHATPIKEKAPENHEFAYSGLAHD